LSGFQIFVAVLGALLGLLLIVCLALTLCVVIAREKRGTPLFAEMAPGAVTPGGRAGRGVGQMQHSDMPTSELQMEVSIDQNA